MGKERDGRERNNDGDVLAQPGNGIATKNKLKQVCDNVTGRGVVGKERDRKAKMCQGGIPHRGSVFSSTRRLTQLN